MKARNLIKNCGGLGIIAGCIAGGIMPTVAFLSSLAVDSVGSQVSWAAILDSLGQFLGGNLYGAFLAAPFGAVLGMVLGLAVGVLYSVVASAPKKLRAKIETPIRLLFSAAVGVVAYLSANLILRNMLFFILENNNPFSLSSAFLGILSLMIAFPRIEAWAKEINY